MKPRNATGLAVLFAAALTTLVITAPFVRFAYRAPNLHLSLEVAEGLIALLTAYLVFGRFRENGLSRDLGLSFALALSGLSNLLLAAVPAALVTSEPFVFTSWAPLLVRIISASILAIAGITSPRVKVKRRLSGTYLTSSAVLTLLMIGAAVAFSQASLPLGIDPGLSPASSQRPLLVGHPILLGAQILLVLLFGVASFGFTRQAEREPDHLIRAVGVGTALAAFARINYFLFPSIYTEFIYTGDILRLLFYLALLRGASREIRDYWRRLEVQIAERDRLNAELEKLALTDPLTGLNNRRGFAALGARELQIAARTGHSLTLLFIDLNSMKMINDRFGHEHGDAALKATSEILRKTLRESDLLCRLGGDEFAALINVPRETTDLVIGKLNSAVDKHNRAVELPYELSLSVGAAPYDPRRHTSLDDLLIEADELMYRQKTARSVRPTLLIVDDEDDILFILDIALRNEYEIVKARTGMDAIEAAKTAKPHIVLLDIALPDVSGLDLIPRLRVELDRRVPIVMITGSGSAKESATLAAGADDYITKPFDEAVLKARLQRHLERAALR